MIGHHTVFASWYTPCGIAHALFGRLSPLAFVVVVPRSSLLRHLHSPRIILGTNRSLIALGGCFTSNSPSFCLTHYSAACANIADHAPLVFARIFVGRLVTVVLFPTYIPSCWYAPSCSLFVRHWYLVYLFLVSFCPVILYSCVSFLDFTLYSCATTLIPPFHVVCPCHDLSPSSLLPKELAPSALCIVYNLEKT